MPLQRGWAGASLAVAHVVTLTRLALGTWVSVDCGQNTECKGQKHSTNNNTIISDMNVMQALRFQPD